MSNRWKLIASAGLAVACWAPQFFISQSSEDGDSPLLVVVDICYFLVALVSPFLVLFYAVRIWKCFRYESGHLSRSRLALAERDLPEVSASSTVGWADGRKLASQLLGGEELVTNEAWSRVLRYGEKAHFDRQAYFADERGEGAANWKVARVAATDRRLICNVDGKWQSYHFDSLLEFIPDLQRGVLTLRFSEKGQVLLSGYGVPLLSVYVAWRAYGVDAVRGHPALSSLVE